MFAVTRKFRRDYDRIFREDPAAANTFLLLAELADGKGDVKFKTSCPSLDIYQLMTARFDDPLAYQLPGGPKR